MLLSAMRHTLTLILLLLVSTQLFAQKKSIIKHGTTLLTLFTRDSTMMAADTRIYSTNGRETFYDTITKIRSFDSMTYGIAGIASIESSTHQEFFNTYSLIDSCLHNTSSPTEAFQLFSNVLSSKIEFFLNSDSIDAKDLAQRRNGGIFLGVSFVFPDQGNLSAIIGVFTLVKTSKKSFDVKFLPYHPSVDPSLIPIGEVQEIRNYLSDHSTYLQSHENYPDKLFELIHLEVKNSKIVGCPIDVVTISTKNYSKNFHRYSCK
jgi:hypothetical protein